jgi:hypothetical protein
MTAPRKRIAIFGDSHYACLRMAQNQGLVDVSAYDVEYWGHVGKRFRLLEFRDGAIHPMDDATAQRFAKFNEKGRTSLPAADFDEIVFVGCRIDIGRVFLALIDAYMQGQYLSLGLRQAMARHRLRGIAPYGMAADMAALGKARIWLHPISMFGQGTDEYGSLITPAMRGATPAARDAVWQVFQDVTAQDGIGLLRQLDHTYAEGVYTDRAYLVEGYAENNDYTHRAPAYGALVWEQIMRAITS